MVIIADGNEPAPPKLIEAVEDNIESQRPIGADVLVLSGQAVDVRVEADVLVKKGYTAEGIGSSFFQLLGEYCGQIAFQSQVISYFGLINLLFACSGVVDVVSFSINGESGSLKLSGRQFPVPQMPEITVEEERDAE